MKKLKWRLSNLPTPLELQELVKNKILTQKEAREILFKEEEVEKDRDLQSFKDEIKFLKDLVETLSKSNRTVVYEYIQQRSYPQPWYQPYYSWGTQVYCGANSSLSCVTSGSNNAMCTNDLTSMLGQSTSTLGQSSNFSDIKTF